MARVKRSVNAKEKRREVLDSTKGYCDQRSCLYRKAGEQMLRSKTYEFRDCRHRKGQFRRPWIQRVNAAARANDVTYNRFVQDPSLTGAEVDRKNLTELTVNDPQALAVLVKVARGALPKDVSTPAAK